MINATSNQSGRWRVVKVEVIKQRVFFCVESSNGMLVCLQEFRRRQSVASAADPEECSALSLSLVSTSVPRNFQ